jgi:hypothetical protein
MRFRTLQYRNQHREHILCSRPEQISSVLKNPWFSTFGYLSAVRYCEQYLA